VFGPGLGEAFQLRVGHGGPQTDLLPVGEDGVVFQVVPEDPHLLETQGEDPLLADPDELRVGNVEVDLFRPRTVLSHDARHVRLDPRRRVPGFPVDDIITLDQVVGEKLGGDPFRIRPREGVEGAPVPDAADDVLPRCVDPDRLSGEERDGLPGGLPHVVRDAGTEPHLDEPVETPGDPVVDGGFLDHRVGKGAAGRLSKLLRGEGPVDRIDLDGLHRIHRNPEVLDDPLSDFFAEGVPDPFFKPDLDPIGHVLTPFFRCPCLSEAMGVHNRYRRKKQPGESKKKSDSSRIASDGNVNQSHTGCDWKH